MKLGMIWIGGTQEGLSVEVNIDIDGKFSAEFGGETYEAETLDLLRRVLRTAQESSRLDVPFVSMVGNHGTMRGYHAANRDLLVTWGDGSKGRMKNYERIFRPENITPEEIDEILRLEREITERQARLGAIRGKGERAADVFNKAFGTDVTEHAYDPDAAEAVAPA